MRLSKKEIIICSALAVLAIAIGVCFMFAYNNYSENGGFISSDSNASTISSSTSSKITNVGSYNVTGEVDPITIDAEEDNVVITLDNVTIKSNITSAQLV